MSARDRVSFIVDQCRGKRVLHVGCADWPYTAERLTKNTLLHAHIARVAARLVGLDMSQQGVALIKKSFPEQEFVVADGCTFRPGEPFDLVVASEVIEHVPTPGLLLTHIRSWISPVATLLLTTPNAYSFKGTLRALAGTEFVHPDHVVMFSTGTLSHLLEQCGWSVKAIEYYQVPGERWFSRVPAACVGFVTRLSPRVSDGLIALATPRPAL